MLAWLNNTTKRRFADTRMTFPRTLRFLGGALFIVVSLLLGFQRQAEVVHPGAFAAPSASRPDPDAKPFYRQSFVSDGMTRLVHSATAVQRRDGLIQAFWFGGSREGHRDVEIFTATFDPAKDLWSADSSLLTREATQAGGLRLVKKLGNPVATMDHNGRIWLFFVSVSIGGWSGSSVNLTVSDDQGRSWSRPRQLITSPFFNLSTLVKGPPFIFADGSLGLPVYHEFLGKFSELLRLDAQGLVIGKTRISSGRQAIQPVIYPFDGQNALVLMRNTCSSSPRRAWAARTHDGGRTWTRPEATEIFNRDSAIAGLVTQDMILAAVNFSERDRSGLSLLLSRNQGLAWSFVHDVEPAREPLAPERFQEEVASGIQHEKLSPDAITLGAVKTQCEPGRPRCNFRFDYPYLIQDEGGVFHLFYTWNRAFIRHVAFNAAWLGERGEQPLDVLKQRGAVR